MTYAEKLQDPRWQKKRLEILNRDNFTCQYCKDQETTLHVHHKSYSRENDPWTYPDTNFITYCSHCHGLIEHINKGNSDGDNLNILYLIKGNRADGCHFYCVTGDLNIIHYLLVDDEYKCILHITYLGFKEVFDCLTVFIEKAKLNPKETQSESETLSQEVF